MLYLGLTRINSFFPPRLAKAVPCLALMLFAAGLCCASDLEGRQGALEPRFRATIASELAMPIEKVWFRAGESFKRGETLVTFNADAARAALLAAETMARAAAASLDGIRLLVRNNQSTALELATAEGDFAAAGARLVAARRELAATTITAPFDGRVAETHLNDHEWAGRGSPIITIVDDTVLQARFLLPETEFPNVREGGRLRVRVPAVAAEDQAEVERTGAVFDAASRTFDVWALMDNRDGKYRAGMTVIVDWP